MVKNLARENSERERERETMKKNDIIEERTVKKGQVGRQTDIF